MANDHDKDRPATGDKGKAEPHRLLQDKPEGSRETIDRELKRQDEKGGGAKTKTPDHRPSGSR